MRGDAFAHFGNAAVVQSIVDKLPEIAREVAAPLSRTEKVRLFSIFMFEDSRLSHSLSTCEYLLLTVSEGVFFRG